MPDPIHERMDALTAANLRLLQRVSALEDRVAELESPRASASREPLPEPEPTVPPAYEFHPAPFSPEPAPLAEKTLAAAPPSEPRAPSLEASVGLNWVNRIGAVTLILGAGFFFKYAVDNAWIGPTGRILLGVIAGALLCGFGYRSWRGSQTIFAQGVTGSGVAVLYLSFWASYSLYELAPAPLAFALMVAVTALGGAFAWLYQAQAMAILSYLAGVSTPFLLSRGEYHPWFFTLYLLVLNAAWLVISRRQGWRQMEWAAAAATVLPYPDFFRSLHVEDRGSVGTAWALLQYPVFASSPFLWLLGLAQLLAGLGAAVALESQTVPGLAVCLLLLAAGLVISEVRKYRVLSLLSVVSFGAGYLLLREGAGAPLPEGTLLLGVMAAFLLAFGHTVWRRLHDEELDQLDLFLLVAQGALYYLAGYELLSHGSEGWRGLFTAGLAVLYILFAWRQHSHLESRADYDPSGVLFSVGAALSLATIAVAVQFAGFRITIIWALEAAGLAWLASRYDQRKLLLPVGALSLLVAARLAAIDALAYPDQLALTPLWNPRFFTHVASALLLAAAAWWSRANRLALVPYLTAHAALLHGLAWENYTWAAQTTPVEGLASAVSIGLTMLGAVYGLVLVIAGVLHRFQLNRLLGLGLLAVVVAKLYVADVWSMERLHRILAFGALGVLLLVTSFFYSHFRAKIEDWIKDDDANLH